ncbi:hypothetical protein OPKNFCMD_4016 [Methylobacterium crusticola]|uniref:Uncharacterized protein n=2 Tax=Methylobacterium crusticola TaxID=1697972 RepID=A0ABQ4R0R4_9HYPH|nr:hypothetical protein [Methylobacterium crusticola]GJD51263.1 hypothetical protein OPKNFCMD_4016 [Methylobacterium crusticola]
MHQVRATMVDRFRGVASTDDGAYTILFADIGGKTSPFAIDEASLFRLMALLSQSANTTSRARKQAEGKQHTFWVEDTDCEYLASENGIVFRFQIPGGMKLSFFCNLQQVSLLTAELDKATRASRNSAEDPRIEQSVEDLAGASLADDFAQTLIRGEAASRSDDFPPDSSRTLSFLSRVRSLSLRSASARSN